MEHAQTMRQNEQAHELNLKELELQLQVEKSTAEKNDVSESKCKPSLPKLPVFNEVTDSIDAYILRFERLAVSAKWDKTIWAVSLASLLQGKALETYQHLSPVEASDFDCVKEALLRCYQCTAEGYRLRFRNVKFHKDETALQFGNRVKNYFQRWAELAECEETYDDLFDLILTEQFLNACDKNMVLFLKEHDIKTFDQVIKLSEMYMEAHTNYGKKVVVSEARKGHNSEPGTGNPVSNVASEEKPKAPSRPCFVCGYNNHVAKDCFHRFGSSKAKERMGKNAKTSVEKAAAVNHEERLMVAKGTMEGVQVNVFRDGGCTTVLVKESLVPKSKFTGKNVTVRLANNMVFTYPEAKINVDTPFFKGVVLAACMPEPVYELVIGNIDGVTDGGMSELGAATTRSQARLDKSERSQPKLKVSDVLKAMKDKSIAHEQEIDKSLNKVREYELTNKVFHKSQSESHSFVKRRGVLYRRVETVHQVSDQLVVPVSFRSAVMQLAHDSLMGGHLGIKKTTQRVLSKFFWPGMTAHIARFCRSCDTCQRTVDKGRVKRVKMGRMPLIQEPFKRVAVDIIGPIEPRASDGSRYILTIVDYATRYPEAIALKNIEACTVAEALLSVFRRVGIPKEVMSDRGSQFTSEVMSEFNRLLSIKSIFTTPYHAMCNGLVEKFNGVLKKMLKRMSREQPTKHFSVGRALFFTNIS